MTQRESLGPANFPPQISAMRQAMVEGRQADEDCISDGLPIISDVTIAELEKRYWTDKSLRDAYVKEKEADPPGPYKTSLTDTELLFSSLAENKMEDFIDAIQSWVNSTHPGAQTSTNLQTNSSAIGMAIVLNLFGIQNTTFFDELNSITKQDWTQSFKQTDINVVQFGSVIERGKRQLRIPSYQVHLNKFIDKFTMLYVDMSHHDSVKLGATGMYRALEYAWPRRRNEMQPWTHNSETAIIPRPH